MPALRQDVAAPSPLRYRPAALDGRRVLIVFTHAPFAYKMAQCFHDAGVRVELLGVRRKTPLRWSRLIDATHETDAASVTQGGPPLAVDLDRIARTRQIDAVFAADMMATVALARAAPETRTAIVAPLDDAERLEHLHDKTRFAALLREHGLPIPRDTHRINPGDTPAQVRALPLTKPLVCKPVDGSNSQGVIKLADNDALLTHLRSGKPGSAPPVLVQEFIPGQDIDFSFLADQGKVLAWAIQQREDFRQSHLEFLRHDEVLRVGRAAVQACRFTGVGHMDLRLDERDGGVYAIELNPRYWGSVQYAAWAGVNFPALHLLAALGEDAAAAFTPCAGTIDNPPPRLRDALAGLLGRPAPDNADPTQRAARNAARRDPLPTLAQALKARLK